MTTIAHKAGIMAAEIDVWSGLPVENITHEAENA